MTQLRLAFSNGKKTSVEKATPTPSVTCSPDLRSSARILQKISRLQRLRPAVVEVIEKLVDDVLDDLEGRRP